MKPLNADRASPHELDAWLAENVMDWKYAGYCRRGAIYEVGCGNTREIGLTWEPSRVREHLMEVIQQMTETALLEAMGQVDDPRIDKAFGGSASEHLLIGMTLQPLAVCRAIVAGLQEPK